MPKITTIIFLFILGIFGGIFADQILWPYFIEKPLFYQYRLEQNPIYLTEKKEITIIENTALQDAIEKVENTIVGVRTKTINGNVLEGSGLIITSDGLFITLNDLIPKGSEFVFYINGQPISFQIIKRDAVQNLALIKVEKNNLSTVGFADLDKIRIGQRVFLIGALLDNKIIKKIANEGIIKSFNQELIETNIFEDDNLAGSPLFDIEGKCLGLSQIDSQGKIIAIPINQIKEFIGL
ncbi:serine protease [Patescibacteria group bacterium]|nr:serine protease [Patescibacteria group bacterium]MBU1877117.1 serine protease [Patescibacteria group bacterium]